MRLVIGCVGPRPQRLTSLEERLRGCATSAELRVRAIADLADGDLGGIDAVDDLHGSADYKLEMARVFLRRALGVAARARGRRVSEARYAHAVVVVERAPPCGRPATP